MEVLSWNHISEGLKVNITPVLHYSTAQKKSLPEAGWPFLLDIVLSLGECELEIYKSILLPPDGFALT